MNRAKIQRGNPPSSSHPEAEAGVEISGSATRPALQADRPGLKRKRLKPIVSIDGRDVEQIPEDNGGRAA